MTENKNQDLLVYLSARCTFPKPHLVDHSVRCVANVAAFCDAFPSTTICTTGQSTAAVLNVMSTGKKSTKPLPSPTATSVDAFKGN